MKNTTVLALRHNGKTVLASDGQVTLGNTIIKHKASKVRKIYDGKILAGFAGSAADGIALLSRFEGKIKEYKGNLERAAVELAQEWRTDKALRRLDAIMIVASKEKLFLLSGTGDLLQPDDDVIAIGSGGPYALAAAKALIKHSNLPPEEIAKEAMEITSSICIYTNDQITIEVLE